MKRYYTFLFIIFVALSYTSYAQFTRTDTISCQPLDRGGYGNLIAGVDLDNDGKTEIYACNSNANDKPEELIPRLYKYELTDGKWELVWSTEMKDMWQNTWPVIALGDLDKDGKKEIIWGPANWVDTEHPNPARVVVFEYPGDGSDNMGVNSFGSFLPNTTYTIAPANDTEIRPFRWFINDIDKDGKDEIIFADRSSSNSKGGYSFGVISVDVIPDDGGTNANWTLEASGKDQAFAGLGNANKWDLAIIDSLIYLFDGSGVVSTIKYESKAWSLGKIQKGLVGDTRVFKGSQVVDIDKDGKKEIVAPNYAGYVYLLQQSGDSLISTQIADYTKLGSKRLVGGASGDVDGDGKIDFIFGSYSGQGTPNGAIYRLKYNGGPISDPNSYTASIIDSLIHENTGQFDAIVVANVDKDTIPEILYTSGYPAGELEYWKGPIAILDYTGPSGIQKQSGTLPGSFFLSQNFPNPFNPSTTIKFGLPGDAVVTLRVFNILGQEVATLLNSEQMSAGSYNVDFNASKLTSGTYIYQLNYNNQTVTKKMLLMK
ncbi:MAG TPA: T9SS type A sorting domain-containing protein [Ignavibacteriales bacterium]|nr:T9SS type A sorting domain-containing protein [Ignavibacteriales bacterium]